jgi:REP element-mobilizing transposase RayT
MSRGGKNKFWDGLRMGGGCLLSTEPQIKNPSTVRQVLKQRPHAPCRRRKRDEDRRQSCLLGDTVVRSAFWQARFYDFNVWTTKNRVEKLRYMHRNPVKRGLVKSPEEWRGAVTVSTFWMKWAGAGQ